MNIFALIQFLEKKELRKNVNNKRRIRLKKQQNVKQQTEVKAKKYKTCNFDW